MRQSIAQTNKANVEEMWIGGFSDDRKHKKTAWANGEGEREVPNSSGPSRGHTSEFLKKQTGHRTLQENSIGGLVSYSEPPGEEEKSLRQGSGKCDT